MTRIVLLSRGFDVWCWLCARCLKAREKQGWEVRASKVPPRELPCEDCN